MRRKSLDEESIRSGLDELEPLSSGAEARQDYPDTDDKHALLGSKHHLAGKQTAPYLGKRRRKDAGLYRLLPSRFCCSLILLFICSSVMLLASGTYWMYTQSSSLNGQSEPWYPTPRGGTVKSWENSYRRAGELVGRMTLPEKINITTGIGWQMGMCVGNTAPVDRLGFPSLCLQDGPLGLRFVSDATALPAGITLGATWNKELMYRHGKAHGLEARMKGVNVLLGPAMGPLGRLPAGGRNWEGFGPDPVLQGIAAAEVIRGIQDTGVIATAKHFVGNEQEHFRQAWAWGTPNAISSNIDDRTLHELYAWPFADAVRAGVGSVMCSYNQVNNSYACQNSKLINGILKDELGFQGFVQSDWDAQRSGVASALAGLDVSMPGDGFRIGDGKPLWGPHLSTSILNGSVPVARLNDMVMRVVAAWYQLGQDDAAAWPIRRLSGSATFSSWTDDKQGLLHPGSPGSTEKGVVNDFVPVRNTEEGGDHEKLARQIAAEGIVLLKNKGQILPLSRDGSGVRVPEGDGKLKVAIFGEDAFSNPNGDNACPDRSCNEGTLAMGWGSGAVDLPYLISPAQALRGSFHDQNVAVTEVHAKEEQKIKDAAASQDLCLAFVNSDAGEGYLSWKDIKGDRNNLLAQNGGDDLIQAVAENCGGQDKNGPIGKTIVVLHTVGPTILERWIDHPGVKAVLIAHLPGQESGNALADVLFGDVNPSGHLPYTIATAEEHYGPTSKILRWPNAITPQQNFTEGLYIDYRHFDKHGISPRYAFGYGLSYTQFHVPSIFAQFHGVTGSEPAPRPEGIAPVVLNETIPDAATAFWPKNFVRLKKYIYPYIEEAPSTLGHADRSWSDQPKRSPSQAGGGQGGNPDLYTVVFTVQAPVVNTGDREGDAVVQLYLSMPHNVTDVRGGTVDMPIQFLRGFEKLRLGINDQDKRKRVEFNLTRRDLSYWDVDRQNWIMPPGDFKVCLGFSSRDLRQCTTLATSMNLDQGDADTPQ